MCALHCACMRGLHGIGSGRPTAPYRRRDERPPLHTRARRTTRDHWSTYLTYWSPSCRRCGGSVCRCCRRMARYSAAPLRRVIVAAQAGGLLLCGGLSLCVSLCPVPCGVLGLVGLWLEWWGRAEAHISGRRPEPAADKTVVSLFYESLTHPTATSSTW